jgi:hypothetical protein
MEQYKPYFSIAHLLRMVIYIILTYKAYFSISTYPWAAFRPFRSLVANFIHWNGFMKMLKENGFMKWCIGMKPFCYSANLLLSILIRLSVAWKDNNSVRTNDTNASGPTTKCSSKHTKNTNKNSSGKNLANDDDFTVPLYYSQEKLALFPTKSLCKSVPAKYSSTDRRHCIS